MARYTNDTSSSSVAASAVSINQTCASCPRVAVPESGSTFDQGIAAQLTTVLTQNLGTVSQLQKDIQRVEKEQDRTRNFYNAITKLSDVSRIVLLILLVIPIVQLIACTAVVYYLGIQEQLSSLLTWVLSSVSVLSIAEVVLIPVKLFTMEKRMDDIEKKIDKIVEKE